MTMGPLPPCRHRRLQDCPLSVDDWRQVRDAYLAFLHQCRIISIRAHERETADTTPSHAPTFSRFRRGKAPISGAQLWGYRVTCACGGYEQRVNGTKAEAMSYWRAHRREATAATRVAVRQEDHVDGNDGTTSTQQDPAQTVTTEASASGEDATATATATGENDGGDQPADEAGDGDDAGEDSTE